MISSIKITSISNNQESSSVEGFFNSDIIQYKRLKSDALTSIRLLIGSGKLFGFVDLSRNVEEFLNQYGYLFFSNNNHLFGSFLFIIDQLLGTCSVMKSNNDELIRTIGMLFYLKSFCADQLVNDLQKEEICGNLFGHASKSLNNLTIGRSWLKKSDLMLSAVLNTLVRLAQSRPKQLAHYNIGLVSLQKYLDSEHLGITKSLDNFSNSFRSKEQIRSIFAILANIAFR